MGDPSGRAQAPDGRGVDSFLPCGEEYYTDDTDHVFAFGHHHSETKTGKSVDVRFSHLWTVRDGKLAGDGSRCFRIRPRHGCPANR